jgi:hypothetical protein
MQADNYTKAVLTAIALFLGIIAFQNIFPVKTAYAGKSGHYLNGPVLNPDGSMNVTLVNSTMDVNLKELGGYSIYGTLPINLKEVSGSSIYSSGIPVNIKALDGSGIFGGALPVKVK